MDTKIIAFLLVGVVVGAAVGAGAGYMMWNESDEEKYSFYLHFGTDDDRNGWYTASATNTNDAFGKAMKNAGFEWTLSNWGYIQSIDGVDEGSGWALYQYLYANTDKEAAEGSVMGGYLNGWTSIAGYGDNTSLHLEEIVATIYFFSVYVHDITWDAVTPVDVDDWMNSGPFAA